MIIPSCMYSKYVHTKRFTRSPPLFTLPAFVLIIMLQTYSANDTTGCSGY